MTKLTVYQQARSRLLIAHPFFATILMSTPAIPNYDIETACTDMVRIWYNPDFIESLSVAVAMFVMVHEACHKMLKHGLRMGYRDPEIANWAMDMAINLMLKKYGFTLWPKAWGTKPEDVRFNDMAWEAIYEIMKKELEAKQGKKKNGGHGESQGMDAKGRPKPRKGMGGENMTYDVAPPEHAGPDELRKIENDINNHVMQAVQHARMAGKLPAGMELLVEGIVKPPVAWYEALRSLMLQTVKTQENWSRPNRRMPMLPSYHNPGIGKVVFIGDSSGSVLSDRPFAQIAAEINECNTLCMPEQTIVVWADADECTREEIFEPYDEVVLHPKGGGGTDMRLPLKYVEKFEPAVVILVTDAETPWPDEPTPFPLIVLTIRDSRYVDEIPDWAFPIRMRL